ncbi:MAG TPA: purine-nucleoside phosphorylase [Campylobacterales bacterium]|nr:purine-nucleoside phosphorylase [Campylobacterales bacterium]
MIVCAGNNETFSFATPIGVGLIESTINLTRIALFDKPDFLIFIGSAGSYGEAKIFDIVESAIGANIELSFWEKNSYTPIDNVIEATRYKNNVSHETKNDVIVNSSNYITTNSQLSKNYLKHNIHLENMEFFALMRVAQEFDIPVLGIFVVTNYTDKDAHKDFLTNHSKAKELLTKYMHNRYQELKK